MLYSKFSWVTYFIHGINSVFMSIPISQFIPPRVHAFVLYDCVIQSEGSQKDKNKYRILMYVCVYIYIYIWSLEKWHRVIYHFFFTARDLEKMQLSKKPSSIYWCAQHCVGHCERSEVRMKLIPDLKELNLYPKREGEGKVHACMLNRFSHVWLFATPWTIAHQAPLSMGFSSQ